jgi:hypothetical protein
VSELKLAWFVDIEIRGADRVSREDIEKMLEAWKAHKRGNIAYLRWTVYIVEIVVKKPAYQTEATVALARIELAETRNLFGLCPVTMNWRTRMNYWMKKIWLNQTRVQLVRPDCELVENERHVRTFCTVWPKN